MVTQTQLLLTCPCLRIFQTHVKMETAKLREVKFVSPYARYLAVLPFAEKQRLEEMARKAEIDRKKRLCPENTFVFQNDESHTVIRSRNFIKNRTIE